MGKRSVTIDELDNGYQVSHYPPPKAGNAGALTEPVKMAAGTLDEAMGHVQSMMGAGNGGAKVSRFAKLKAALAGRPGVTNPGGLAASIGRKKYGEEKMEAMSQAGVRKKAIAKIRAKRAAAA